MANIDLQDLDREYGTAANDTLDQKRELHKVLAGLPSATLEDKDVIEENLRNWLDTKNLRGEVPTIPDLAKYSLSPDVVIINKLTELKLDWILQFMKDQERAVLEKQGLDGSGVVANKLLDHKHNLAQDGINPLEVKFVPELKTTNYQKVLLKELEKQGLLTDPTKVKEIANKLLDDYALDSGERFPTQKK